jgi:hypothetical protein
MSLAPPEAEATEIPPSLEFPSTWGEVHKALNILGLGGPYGGRRIILMQQAAGEYSSLRGNESDLSIASGFHRPDGAFDDPEAVAKMQDVFRILGVPNGSSAERTVQSGVSGFRGRTQQLVGH